MQYSIFFILMLSVALAMDAFAVAISLGMSGLAKRLIERLKIGLTFGFFQASMFILGFFGSEIIGDKYSDLNKYISAILLSILGIKMIKEAFDKKAEICTDEDCPNCKKNKCQKTGEYKYLSTKTLLIYGTATSIDSFAAGVSFGLIYTKILLATLLIGLITFLFSYIGATSGSKFKKVIGNKANILGGIILIFLGIKSLF